MKKHFLVVALMVVVFGCGLPEEKKSESKREVVQSKMNSVQERGYPAPVLLKLPANYKKDFTLDGEAARHVLQLDPYCGHLTNFWRADFDGDGQTDEIAWYVIREKSIQLGCRFSVETKNERYHGIDEKRQFDASKGIIMLDQALEFVKKENVTSPFEEGNLDLKNNAVQVYHCEKSAYVLYWDSVSSKFKRYWTGD
jgi:hypothetical protein